jgi:hypothetical protein
VINISIISVTYSVKAGPFPGMGVAKLGQGNGPGLAEGAPPTE